MRDASFGLAGRLFVVDLGHGPVPRRSPVPCSIPGWTPPACGSPTWRTGPCASASFDDDRMLVGEDDPDVTWGMCRVRRRRGDGVAAAGSGGHPTASSSPCAGSTTLPSSTCTSAIRPSRSGHPSPLRYPEAGTPNAVVTLHVLGLDGGSVEVIWDRADYPYLGVVCCAGAGAVPGHGDVARPAPARGPRRRCGQRADTLRAPRRGRSVDRADAGRAELAGRLAGSPSCRPGRVQTGR